MMRALVIAAMLAMAPLPAMAQTFGALAYSPETGGWGSAYNYSSQGAAQQRALNECSSRHRGCRNAIWFRDACGAIARAPNGGWGSGWGGTVDRAMVEALSACQSHGNRGCAVLATLCSSQ